MAALGVRMIDGSGKFLKESKRAFPGPLTSFYKLSGLSALFPKSRIFARYYLGNLSEKKSHEVDVLAGAFIMLPATLLKKVSGFDEDFFMYGEDIDLSFRIQQAGFSNYYFADTTIIHFKGESTRKESLNYVKLFYKAMSIFVDKHYKSSKGNVFNLLIKIGILLRGGISTLSRFLKWIGMPVIDGVTILLSFWIVKKIWIFFLLPYLAFDRKILFISFPVYTVLFLLTSYYSGLYDNGFRQAKLNRAVIISTLILFTIYALVPEATQFSRGLLLSSIFVAFILMSAIRNLLLASGIVRKKERLNSEKIAIAGTAEEYAEVMQILKYSNRQDEVLGRIGCEPDNGKLLCVWQNHIPLLQSGAIDRIIYCRGRLSLNEIILSLEQLPKEVQAAFFTDQGSSIIDSNDKNISGEYETQKEYFNLENRLNLRVKRLCDVALSGLFIIAFPLTFLIKKNPVRFIKNCLLILFNKRTFVGYATPADGLPALKTGILTTTGLRTDKNILPTPALIKSDNLYAKEYSIFTDLKFIYYGFQNLS